MVKWVFLVLFSQSLYFVFDFEIFVLIKLQNDRSMKYIFPWQKIIKKTLQYCNQIFHQIPTFNFTPKNQKMSFQMQQQIKHNAQQIRSYVTDLYDWQQQMELKQKAKIRVLKQERAKQQEISKQLQKQILEKKKQQKAQPIKQVIQSKPKKDLIRDATTIKDYYNAWGKYDLDKQIQRLQQEQTRPYKPYNPYEHSQNYVRAKPKAKVNINIKGQRTAVIDPTQLKDKGNLHFKVCDYEKAINSYTQCLQKLQQQQSNQKNNKIKCVVFSNRAISFLKLNERAKALHDCNQSLRYDPTYAKSYLRRAQCHKKLGNYKQSLSDYKMVKQLDPEDNLVDSEILKIQKYLQKLYKQARQSLILRQIPVSSVQNNSYRIPIEEVQEIEQVNQQKKSSKSANVNHLEQL